MHGQWTQARAATLVAEANDGPDVLHLQLLQAYLENRVQADALARLRDTAETAALHRGQDACPVVQGYDFDLERLDSLVSSIARRLTSLPADGIVGAAVELVIWRAEAALTGPDFEDLRDVFAFAAYRDLMRLSGLEMLAHPLDGRTLAIAEKWLGGRDPVSAD